MSHDFTAHLLAFIASTIFAGICWAIAYFCGLFSMPPARPHMNSKAAFYLCFTGLLAFTSFLLIETVLAPFLFWLALCGQKPLCLITIPEQNLSNLLMIAVIAAIVFLLSMAPYQHLRKILWGDFSWRSIFIGMSTWLVSFPTMFAAIQLSFTLLFLFGPIPTNEQVPVKELLHIKEYPWLLSLTFIVLATLVPLTEEILFRGFLLNILIYFFNELWAVILSSAIFACFHFSTQQGMSNVIFISSLFVLACFLGFLYLRQRSLWAPIALHSTFNMISMMMILT